MSETKAACAISALCDRVRFGDLRDVLETAVVLLIGVAAGVMNALGGGGTFVALPALVALGMPPVTANAVSRIALVPGAFAGVWVYRRDLAPVGGVPVRRLTAVSVVGSAAGAVLLLVLPASSFDAASPWLLAFATLLLAFGRGLTNLVTRVVGHPVQMRPRTILVCQFFVAAYGGYFGGALGILMVAVWSVGVGIGVAAANPMRLAQLAAVFLVSGVLFLFVSDALGSPLRLVTMLVGATVGGWAGAHLARRMPSWLMRAVLLITATVMTVLYFLRG